MQMQNMQYVMILNNMKKCFVSLLLLWLDLKFHPVSRLRNTWNVYCITQFFTHLKKISIYSLNYFCSQDRSSSTFCHIVFIQKCPFVPTSFTGKEVYLIHSMHVNILDEHVCTKYTRSHRGHQKCQKWYESWQALDLRFWAWESCEIWNLSERRKGKE